MDYSDFGLCDGCGSSDCDCGYEANVIPWDFDPNAVRGKVRTYDADSAGITVTYRERGMYGDSNVWWSFTPSAAYIAANEALSEELPF